MVLLKADGAFNVSVPANAKVLVVVFCVGLTRQTQSQSVTKFLSMLEMRSAANPELEEVVVTLQA